ncbi:tail fiber domain-containing protein, partial [Escherichia coli]|nr:tail fiber domain-containing protein [Escherichia coli]
SGEKRVFLVILFTSFSGSLVSRIPGAVHTVNGSVNCTTLNQSSDRRLKENIEIIDNATDAIRKINGYTWVFPDHGGKAQNAIFSFP